MPEGQSKLIIPRRGGEIARRAGVPTSPDGEPPCLQGRMHRTFRFKEMQGRACSLFRGQEPVSRIYTKPTFAA